MKMLPCFFALLTSFMFVGTQAQAQTEEVCVATGRFNLSPDQSRLLMEVVCDDDRREMKTPPRGGKAPLIFTIPFELAVVSIMDEGTPDFRLHLHYELEGDPVHHLVHLRKGNGDYAYSFAHLVPEPVKPIPLVKKKEN